MKDSQVHFHWQQRNHHARFRTGVSVHGHTLHSRESLDFIGRVTEITADGEVCATFTYRKSRAMFRGQYDRDWFAKYPNGLVKIEPAEGRA